MLKLYRALKFLLIFLLFIAPESYAATCWDQHSMYYAAIGSPTFKRLDLNGDGFLNEAELLQPEQNFCEFYQTVHSDLNDKTVRDYYDLNHDGLYSEEEFNNWRLVFSGDGIRESFGPPTFDPSWTIKITSAIREHAMKMHALSNERHDW